MSKDDFPPPMDDEGFIYWLRAHESWYERSSYRCHRVLVACRIIPIIVGFLVAIVSSTDEKSAVFGQVDKDMVVIVLTGISTLCVAVVTQLGLTDLARIREVGRIDCANLVVRALLFFTVKRDEAEALKEKELIRAQILKIERDQAALFASLTSRPERERRLEATEEKQSDDNVSART